MSKTTNNYKPSPGKLRASHLITTFGPGSLYPTEHDCVLIMGTNFWKTGNFSEKSHLYLQKITGKTHFLMPVKKDREQSITCMSFPKWGFCKSCKWLQYHKDYPPKDKGFLCASCPEKYNPELLPARLIVTCNQGHLDEFPWIKWAHSNPDDPVPVCDNPKLIWKGGQSTSSLSNYFVKCKTCNAINSLFKSQDRDKGIQLWDSENNTWYSHLCTGQLPWLQQAEPCRRVKKDGTKHSTETEIAFGITPRASSLYYSKVIKGLIIPSLAHPIVRYLTSKIGKSRIDGLVDFGATDEQIAANFSEKIPQFKRKSYSTDEILYFMRKIQSRYSKQVLETESDLKKIEYDDLRKNESEHRLDKTEINPEIVIKSLSLDDDEKKVFDDIREISVLTALDVSRYFTRITPPGDISGGKQNSKHNFCYLESKGGKTIHGMPTEKQDWLPCAVKKGEGIFIVFNNDFIKNCLKNNKMRQRLDDMIINHKEWESTSNWPSSMEIDQQFILLHSLSHLLIKELALESGYNEASISERIYSSSEMQGLLIYTTSAGDGSLGGLVRQSKNLLDILEKALRYRSICSRDPICIKENPKTMREKRLPLNLRQNGSACFGCMLLPETSCENFNKMLDRQILVDENFGVKSVISND